MESTDNVNERTPERKKSEKEFGMEVLDYFNDKLSNKDYRYSVEVTNNRTILSDFTMVKYDGQWKLVAGVLQQDVVFYCPEDNISRGDFSSNVVRLIRHEKDDNLIIPLLILELKLGASINTHQIITYSSISTHIKTIFPFCAYYLVMDSDDDRKFRPETIQRHTKGFDKFYTNWSIDKDILWADINEHFDRLSKTGLIRKKGE